MEVRVPDMWNAVLHPHPSAGRWGKGRYWTRDGFSCKCRGYTFKWIHDKEGMSSPTWMVMLIQPFYPFTPAAAVTSKRLNVELKTDP